MDVAYCVHQNNYEINLIFSCCLKKQFTNCLENCFYFVRVEGLEPPRREALDPKSSMSTNFITPAMECKDKIFTNKIKSEDVFF